MFHVTSSRVALLPPVRLLAMKETERNYSEGRECVARGLTFFLVLQSEQFETYMVLRLVFFHFSLLFTSHLSSVFLLPLSFHLRLFYLLLSCLNFSLLSYRLLFS
jgi:hypothetical protein